MSAGFAASLDLTSASESFKTRFWSKVDIRAKDECWPWTAYRKPSGYGQFMMVKGRFQTASRVALALTQPIPDGYSACHRCDNPPCCNPGHLFAGTSRDNANDSVKKNRARRAQGEDTFSARLTEDDVVRIRSLPGQFGLVARLAEEYDVSATTIRRARAGLTWSHVPVLANQTTVCTKGHEMRPGQVSDNPRIPCPICAETYRVSRLKGSKEAA